MVAAPAIDPNTVLKAYRELEHEGLVAPRHDPRRTLACFGPNSRGGSAG